MAMPIPVFPPVTMATFPSSAMVPASTHRAVPHPCGVPGHPRPDGVDRRWATALVTAVSGSSAPGRRRADAAVRQHDTRGNVHTTSGSSDATTTIPVPPLRSARSARTRDRFSGSSSAVGSSATKMSGSPAIARATPTLWRSPPDSCSTGRPRSSPRPTEASASSQCRAISRGGVPRHCRGRATFSSAVSPSTRPWSCSTSPTVDSATVQIAPVEGDPAAGGHDDARQHETQQRLPRARGPGHHQRYTADDGQVQGPEHATARPPRPPRHGAAAPAHAGRSRQSSDSDLHGRSSNPRSVRTTCSSVSGGNSSMTAGGNWTEPALSTTA